MFLFLKFLLAHILGDFVFQSKKWVNDKEKNKVKSIFYLSIGSHFSSGASMSKNRFDYEIKHTDVEYLPYLEKKSERFIEKLIKKNNSNREKCS